MPEGDTVWLVASRLADALSGQQVVAADLRVPALATVDLGGSTVLDVVPRGKHLLMRLAPPVGPPLTLHSHLRMEGMWHLYRPGSPPRGGPDHAIRAIVTTTQAVAVGYRLGELDLVATSEENAIVGHLGPDPLGTEFDAAAALANILDRPERMLGEALLDQRNVAGLGTNLVSEACFLVACPPHRVVADAPTAEVLATAIRLIQLNRGRAVRVTTGRTSRGATSWVHARRTCLRCGGRVRRTVVGDAPRQRTLAWCPVCQPSQGNREGNGNT